jgi:hypothetical protein
MREVIFGEDLGILFALCVVVSSYFSYFSAVCADVEKPRY